MWGMCQWLCPKRKEKREAYDVHEDTFEMDENIGQMEIEDKSPDIQVQHNSQPESGQALNVPSLPNEESAEDQRKFIQQKNNLQKEEREKVEEAPPPVSEKPKPKYNILPTKSIKKKYDPANFQFKGEEGEFKVKAVDSLKGQQFNIDGCKNCFYFIFDVTANIYIDDCEDCFIFAAPVESSIFVRSCKNMVVVGITGQFRVYNCHNSHFSLLCKSQPVIESSQEINFSSLECPEYSKLWEQMMSMKLYPWNNNWSQIHNFTPKEGEKHHTLHRNRQYEIEVDWMQAFEKAGLEMVNESQKVAPFIQGNLPLDENENPEKVLVLFGAESSQEDKSILEWVLKNNIELLKASKLKQEGKGKDEFISLLVKQNPEVELEWSEVGSPVVVSEKEEVEGKEGKYFINFGDER